MPRWRALGLPAEVPGAAPALDPSAGPYDYAPPPSGEVAFHVNFADPRLFIAYGGSLLAQDEMQVAEHPALGSVREALAALSRAEPGLRPLTVEAGRPTPVLVTGVERRCAIDARRIYGSAFRYASEEEIREATRAIEPPTTTHVLAMAALGYGQGRYEAEEISSTLETAYTGFAAARLEAARLTPGARVAVHTGFWGCGAFGGNRDLMALLQIVAARLAGLDRLVFHAFDASGAATFARAMEGAETLAPGGARVADVIASIEAKGFVWGRSDGN